MSYVANAEVIILNQTVEKIYSIESLTLSGDLESNSLSLTGNGEVISGDNVRVYLLGPTSDILIRDLKVNDVSTPLSFDNRGYFFLMKEGKFNLQAIIELGVTSSIGQINLNVPGPVNKLNSDLQHGYIVGNNLGLLNDNIIIERSLVTLSTEEGEFKFTFSDENEFFYLFRFKSFGRALSAYQIGLQNGEIISSVNGATKWEQKNNDLFLYLEGNEATVTVDGIFNTRNISLPFRGKVLIESDPQRKISLTTTETIEEIDLSELTITPKYSNARAFLLNTPDYVDVSIDYLGLKPSLTATINQAANKIAITTTGSILGETNYYYSNTGLEYLKLDIDGIPLYAAANYQPVKLTEDNGNLFLSFPKMNNGQLTVSYFSTRSTMLPVDVINIPLARSDLPISEENTEIFLPKDVFVLETFGVKGGSELPSLKNIIIFSALMLLLGYLLIGQSNLKFMLSFFIFIVGAYMFDIYFFFLVLGFCLVLILRRYTNPEQFKKILIIGGGIALVVLILLGVFGFLGSFISQRTVYREDYVSGGAVVDKMTVAPTFQGLQKIGEGEGAITVATREGVLPVQMRIPDLGKSIRVTNHLVTKEHPTELRVLVISEWFLYVFYLIALAYGVRAYSLYKESLGVKLKTRK